MPDVLRIQGFIFAILHPPREHGPAHVHVWKAGEEIVIGLVHVRTFRSRMTRANARVAIQLVEENAAFLLAEWRKIHG